MIVSGNSSNLEKTQGNIQKLKLIEHQVRSCSQKKCKIKPPEQVCMLGLLANLPELGEKIHLSQSTKKWGKYRLHVKLR